MNKSDLKSGMTVQYRNGWLRLVRLSVEKDDELIIVELNRSGTLLESYDKDMNCIDYPGLDIVKVYAADNNQISTKKLLWEREG